MARRYDNIYAHLVAGQEVDMGMRKEAGLVNCDICHSETAFYDMNFKKRLCSEDCRGIYWTNYCRENLSGYYKNYLVIFKNKTDMKFPDVKVWFTGRYLYFEQQDESKYKGRLDTYDIADIQPGVKYEGPATTS